MIATSRALPAGVGPLMPGDPPVLGPYTLVGRLGSGGMGVVYLGEPAASEGPGEPELVAIKTLHAAYAEDPEARQRFRAEAEYAQRVASFCTARVIADGSDRSSPYLVTEFIEGPPLSEVVERDGPLPAGALQAVAIGVADALDTIHRAGVAHRDLKPANVLLARSGPRIIDFGIAHALDASGGPTQAGVVMGSPGWIAPERLTGGSATAASDVFCWGLLVAYAALGRHPFGTGDAGQLAERMVSLPPDLSGMKEPLRGLAAAALAKDPAVRPSPADLLSDLLAPRAEPTAALAVAELWEPPPRLLPRLLPLGTGLPGKARHWPRAGLAAVWVAAVAVLAAGAFINLNTGSRAEPPPRHVEVTVTATDPRDPARTPEVADGHQPGGRPSPEATPSQSPTTPVRTSVPPSSSTPPASPKKPDDDKAKAPKKNKNRKAKP